MGDHREEGELSEEGELPEEEEQAPASKATSEPTQPAAAEAPAAVGQQRLAGSSQHKSPAAQERPGSGAGPSAASSRGLARADSQQRDSYEQRERERQAARRDEQQHPQQRGGGSEPDGRQREQDKLRAEREKAELAAELDRLTYDLSFQEVRGNFVNACQDLRTAIKKLDKLLRRVKVKREDDVSLYPGCHEYAGAIFNALKHVTVICSTGLGRMADTELANALMRTAINYRHDVFSATQKRDLEQQLRDSREFRHLFTDRNRGRSSGKANSTPGAAAASSGGQAAGAGSSRQEAEHGEQQQRLPLQRGPSQQLQQQQGPMSGRSDGMQTSSKDEAVSEASHAAAGAPVSSPVPPSPPGAARSGGSVGVATPGGAGGAADGAATDTAGNLPAGAPDAAGSSSLVGAAAGSSSRGQPLAAAGGGSRGQIRIVLNSSVIAGGAAGAGGDGGGPSGLKRGAPDILDLEADDEDEQAAKRARQQQPDQQAPQHNQQQQSTAAADEGGAAVANGSVCLSELPEVAAALNNPGQLQLVLQSLLSSHRLCLVLDLDHTLVNSAKFSEVDPEWEFKLEQLAADQMARPRELRDLHRLGRVGMWTKLRPGVRDFLQRAAERFELWIYTAGSKAYADAMVDLLDPAGQYFGGRVIAQGVGGGADEAPGDVLLFKRLMQGLEGREPVVVIVDDSSAVWPHDRRNLFVVERYIYFPSSRKRFGMQGKSLLEIDRDECPSRGMLMTALRIFERLHQRVFARLRGAPPLATPEAVSGWDVRNVMASEKKLVLQGVHLVFSRVIPLESNPRQHPLWQLAEQFGATCGEQVTATTTHVVATHGGTEKVMWAKQNNKHVVSPAWLECSCILWQRAHEERFPTPY